MPDSFLTFESHCFDVMLKRERQAYILHQVNPHNKVLSSSLSQGRESAQKITCILMLKRSIRFGPIKECGVW